MTTTLLPLTAADVDSLHHMLGRADVMANYIDLPDHFAGWTVEQTAALIDDTLAAWTININGQVIGGVWLEVASIGAGGPQAGIHRHAADQLLQSLVRCVSGVHHGETHHGPVGEPVKHLNTPVRRWLRTQPDRCPGCGFHVAPWATTANAYSGRAPGSPSPLTEHGCTTQASPSGLT